MAEKVMGERNLWKCWMPKCICKILENKKDFTHRTGMAVQVLDYGRRTLVHHSM